MLSSLKGRSLKSFAISSECLSTYWRKMSWIKYRLMLENFRSCLHLLNQSVKEIVFMSLEDSKSRRALDFLKSFSVEHTVDSKEPARNENISRFYNNKKRKTNLSRVNWQSNPRAETTRHIDWREWTAEQIFCPASPARCDGQWYIDHNLNSNIWRFERLRGFKNVTFWVLLLS